MAAGHQALSPITAPHELVVDGACGRIVDLPSLFGAALPRLPVVLRLLLENVVRCSSGAERDASIAAILAWAENGTSDAEIAFQPGRVLMHDTTSTPALVDIAAMRDALAEAGRDPARLAPVLPVDVSVDHSLAVEVHARPDAAAVNLMHEMRRNRERYAFLKWAQGALGNVRIHPPGTGIMHTINLEQLATVVAEEDRDGDRWVVPDTMVGTDSHTPMVNGIGVLGWGVGGLEAQTVMFGMPTTLRIPDVVGVRLAGALPPGSLATDLALTVTHRLRALGVAGEFVEFFGPGVATLDAGERSVVANMAPEYGATTGYFAIDARTLDYLRATGRARSAAAPVETYAKRIGALVRPRGRPALHAHADDRPGDGGHARRRAAAPAGSAAARRHRGRAARSSTSAPPQPTLRCRAIRSRSRRSRAAPTPPTRACSSPPGSSRGARASAASPCRRGSRLRWHPARPQPPTTCAAPACSTISPRSASTSSAMAARRASATRDRCPRRSARRRRPAPSALSPRSRAIATSRAASIPISTSRSSCRRRSSSRSRSPATPSAT